MTTPLYRKTEAGHTEVRERRAGLDSRSRSLLILCNGRLDEGALSEHLRGPVAERLQDLLARGLLELAPATAKVAASPPIAAPPARAPVMAVPMATLRRMAAPFRQRVDPKAEAASLASADVAMASGGVPDTLPDIVRRGWQLLEPLFGPGTVERMAPLQRADSAAALRQALDELRDTLAIYRGRKAAAELVRRIELG